MVELIDMYYTHTHTHTSLHSVIPVDSSVHSLLQRLTVVTSEAQGMSE